MSIPHFLPKDLDNFIKTYEKLANKRNFDLIEPYIANDALFWFSDGSFKGIEQIRGAFENTWSNLKDEIYTISEVTWLVQTESSAVCIYKFTSESTFQGQRVSFKGRGTNVLRKKEEKWQIMHEHLSLEPKKK